MVRAKFDCGGISMLRRPSCYEVGERFYAEVCEYTDVTQGARGGLLGRLEAKKDPPYFMA